MSLREQFQTPLFKRLLGLALLVALIMIGGRLLLENRVTVEVVYELGPTAPAVRGLVVTYRRVTEGEGGRPQVGPMELRKRYNYQTAGAPENEHHTVRLKPGRYQVDIVVERTTGTQTFRRTIDIRSNDEVIRIDAQG